MWLYIKDLLFSDNHKANIISSDGRVTRNIYCNEIQEQTAKQEIEGQMLTLSTDLYLSPRLTRINPTQHLSTCLALKFCQSCIIQTADSPGDELDEGASLIKSVRISQGNNKYTFGVWCSALEGVGWVHWFVPCLDPRSACQELLRAPCHPLKFNIMHTEKQQQAGEGNIQYRWIGGDVEHPIVE